ncbi:MAG: lantibiotic dehydratase family protein, partial [Bacteroidota bacterium]
FNVYKKLTAEETISDEALKAICQEKAFMEALFLASPSLYDSMLKWLEQGIKDPKKDEKLKLSLLKYLSRMSTRCTPFGLFAGCTLGEFSDTTSIELSGIQENDRHTRLDMNFLVALAQDLAKIKEVSDQLLFYPNTSIYEAGEQLRYVEYRYINGRRQHSITGVENSYYLEGILTKAKEGCLLDTLAKTLVDEDISYEDAREFVDELVNSQLLISELEPSVSGREFMEHLQEVLAKIEGAEEILAALRRTSKSLQQLDQDVGNNPEMYLSIIESLKALGTKFEKKFMFQTDMSIAAKSNFLSKSLLQDLQQGFALLNKLTLPPSNRPIEGFREAYIERFETREMPLSKVLDTEIGIGYPHFRGAGDPNPLIDDIRLPLRRSKHVLKELNWTTLNSHLQKKLLDAKSKRDYSLHLTDQEFEGYEAKWNDLPDTMSFMLEVIQDGDQEKIRILGGFGISAANLLGRFCHSNTAIFEHVKRIV